MNASSKPHEDIRLHYEVAGPEGAPWLTLAHSLATDIRMWEKQVDVFSQYFRVLSFDARGHGASDVPTGPYQMQDLVKDVLVLWAKLGIEKSSFLGLSMGGMTGVGVALSAPEKIEKLIACDCRLDAPEFFQAMWRNRINAVQEKNMVNVVDQTLATWFTPERLEAGGPMIERVKDMIVSTPQKGYMSCAVALQGLDFKRHLSKIRVPTLYIVGQLDGPHPMEMSELCKLTPRSKFVTLERAAHLSNIEQPAEFNKTVLDFLSVKVS